MADPISGELVIVPDAEANATNFENVYTWDNAMAFAEAYSDGENSDYRLPTRAEALKIFGNSYLVTLAGLPLDREYWTSEEVDLTYAYAYWDETEIIEEIDKGVFGYALPVRKVNFYGLPLIESEFGGGLVYDVVAATREVKVIPKWSDVIYNSTYDWDTAIHKYPSGIGEVYFMALPTRAQALKIFGNSYLVTLADLPLDNGYWTSEELNETDAWKIDTNFLIDNYAKTELYYALPVRSETV